jgi:hypothetical protein
MNGEEIGGLSKLHLEIYSRAGIGRDEALLWRASGVGPYPAQRAVEIGLTLEQASFGIQAGLFPTAVRQLLDRGIQPEDFEKWESAAGDASFVIWALDRGLSPEEFDDLVSIFNDLEQDGVDLEQCRRWFDDGIDVAAVANILGDGQEIDEIRDQIDFYQHIGDRDQRAKWVLLAKYVPLGTDVSGRSLTPLEVLWGCEHHSSDFQSPELVFDFATGEYMRIDQEEVPAPMAAPKSRRISVAELRTLGATVSEVDSISMFLDSQPDGLAVVAEVPVENGSTNKTKQRMVLSLGLSPGVNGTWLISAVSPVDTRILKIAPDRETAFRLVATIVGDVGQWKSVSSRAFTATEILELLAPITCQIRGKSIKLNQRTASVSVDPQGDCFLLPHDIEKWPGFREVNTSVFLIGCAVFVKLRSSQVISVGSIDEPNDQEVLIAVRSRIPAVEKSEISVDGEIMTSSVYRSSSATFELQINGVVHSTIGADSLSHALPLFDDFITVRNDRLTQFQISPCEDLDDYELVTALSIESGHISPADLAGAIEDEEKVPEWAEEFLDSPSDHFDFLPLAINGSRVAKFVQDGPANILLTESIQHGGAPIFMTEWIEHGWIETASMTSGYYRWIVGLVAPGVVCEWWKPDEGWPEATLFEVEEPDRLRFIANWLVNGPGSSIDLAMFAVEQICGDDAFGWSCSVALGAEFDDNASSSLETELWINVSNSEVGEFLQALRDEGRGDAVDAVRSPGSDAWQYRRARVERAESPD